MDRCMRASGKETVKVLRAFGKAREGLARLLTFLLILILPLGMLLGCAKKGSGTQVQTESLKLSKSESLAGDTVSEEAEATESGDLRGSGYEDRAENSESEIDREGTYTSPEEVALYLHIYGQLPSNYVSKDEARAAGWDNKKGNLDQVLPGKSIGGDRFGNYEGLLPKEEGRRYYECDTDYEGGYRSAGRLIYSNDGLIYYTEDHYKTFIQLY